MFKQLAAAALLVLGVGSAAQADVIVLIQPSADLNDIVWTVSWDSLDGAFTGSSFSWDAMNPADGTLAATTPWGSSRLQTVWGNVGSPFGGAYITGASRGFGDASGAVASSPGGWGVGPDNDGPGSGNELYIFSTVLTIGDAFPTSGSFVLTVPGAYLANYNIGVYNNNSNATITVTDTPHSGADPIPEPATLTLLGLATLGGGIYRRRRKRA